ncbi:SDR family oxidoreductase [Aphanizomenon sp. CS-733/32]|uniref:SDR family oxidoreductase n=1 Tax=Aphanizomenon sp. CS-733/32 TaxID=3021715 RepID=UPI00232FE941|nr:SDR family oxidoreductase [Aphanizomenon sp. CS-733/32]MDB9308197.1 SDR family oxidoreductase [Aphanizomenon sp. CS-733/32]
MDIRCEGRHALIGGSTAGIGRACAIVLAEQGASITLIARNEQKLLATLKELKTSAQQNHGYIVADFSHPDSLKEKVDAYLLNRKNVDILINNTGGPPLKPALEATAEDLRIAFNQHLICFHLLSQTVIPKMKEVGYGRIINITSYTAKQPLTDMIVSNTIRGAVSSWAKTMANELGSYGITVNNVLPGSTATERLFSIAKDRIEMTGQSEEKVMDDMEKIIPLGRFGKPEEIAWAVAFIASPAASYINGINFPVDGGKTKSL